MPFVADSLAAGALIAIFFDHRDALRRPAFRAAALISLLAVLAMMSLAAGGMLARTLIETVQLPLLAWVTIGAAVGFTGPLGWVLSNPLLRYLGRISYGIYVWHMFVPRAAGSLLPHGTDPYVLVLVYSSLTVGIAAVSWHFFEAPINRLKDRFCYVAVRPAIVAEAPAIQARRPSIGVSHTG